MGSGEGSSHLMCRGGVTAAAWRAAAAPARVQKHQHPWRRLADRRLGAGARRPLPGCRPSLRRRHARLVCPHEPLVHAAARMATERPQLIVPAETLALCGTFHRRLGVCNRQAAVGAPQQRGPLSAQAVQAVADRGARAAVKRTAPHRTSARLVHADRRSMARGSASLDLPDVRHRWFHRHRRHAACCMTCVSFDFLAMSPSFPGHVSVGAGSRMRYVVRTHASMAKGRKGFQGE